MAPRRPKQWPPASAPRTTTSPIVQVLLEDLEEILRAARPGWWQEGTETVHHEEPTALVHRGDLDALLGEVRRLQEHESRLRDDLTNTFELTRLLFSSREETRTELRELRHRLCCLLLLWVEYGDPGDVLSLHSQSEAALQDNGYPLEVGAEQLRRDLEAFEDGTRPADDRTEERG